MHPFDRLVRAVDDAAGRGLVWDEIFAQVGQAKYHPRNMEWVGTLDREVFSERVASARALIAHAGMGTILAALAAGKPLLVMPRLSRYREHMSDHQVATARVFEGLGHVLAAKDETEIARVLERLRTFVPQPRCADPRPVIERVRAFLADAAESVGSRRRFS